MNIGYVKMDKLNKFNYVYRNLLKKIRVVDNYYYLPSNSEKILSIVREKLKQDNIDYIIQEKDIDCGYPELTGKYNVKYMLPEIITYCFKLLGKDVKMQDIYICVNEFSKENISIIEELCQKVKTVNIVTEHLKPFQELEKRLERKEIYITTSSNKRKALSRALITINIDFKDLKKYNINRKSIIVNSARNIELGKDFEGICIEKVLLDTKKVMRIFSDMQNMDKQKLIEGEIIKQTNKNDSNYTNIRESIIKNKIHILKLLGKRTEIDKTEFFRLGTVLFQKLRTKSEKY